MVLESLMDPAKAEKRYGLVLLLGFLFAIVGGILASALKGPSQSMLFVFFTAIPAIPLMYAIIKYEEEKDLKAVSEKTLLKEHSKALRAFMFLFFGMILGMVTLFVFAPWSTTVGLFETQIHTLEDITNSMTGMVTESQITTFNIIFFNNMKVLILSIIFSFLFGAGAIFILSWNASVIAAAIGSFIRSQFNNIAELVGITKVAQYFEVVTIGLLMFALHGIPEILAYFTAALAGGIISVAIIRHDFGTENFERIIIDSADLIFISLVLLLIAALLEVFVTPVIF